MKLITLTALLGLFATPAMADERNFVLVNTTTRTVAQVFVSPANVNEWEEDILTVDVLPVDRRVTIRFVDDLDQCEYDIKVVHDDGDSAVFGGINLCEASEVSISYQDNGLPLAYVE